MLRDTLGGCCSERRRNGINVTMMYKIMEGGGCTKVFGFSNFINIEEIQSDTFCHGKYLTILSLSLVYCVGNWVRTSTVVPESKSGTNSLSLWMTIVGLVLIAAGTGGIKPCVSAFGGDQIEFSLPNGPVKERLWRQVFSLYYLAINSGSLISTLLTTILRESFSYA